MSAAPPRAELVADAGAGAESDDLFRCRPFLDAERVTHTLRVSGPGRVAAVPLIVREIDAPELVDATSPYGYPGALVRGAGPAPTAAEVDWSATGLVSVFARERLAGEPWLAGARERSTVLFHDPARPRRIRARLGEQIRANERDGWAVSARAGPESAEPERAFFARAYAETMRRARAAERYLFAREYLDSVLAYRRSWLLTASRDGAPGAAAIAGVSDGILHYYLGGTADAARDASPFKNVVASMLELADRLALPLNLGGGVLAGDGLERFKRGFANAERGFRVQQVVCDPDAYDRLASGRRGGDFFPAYRAGSGPSRARGGAG